MWFRETARRIFQQSLHKLITAERRYNRPELDSQPDLLCTTIPAEAYDSRIQDPHDVQLIQQSAYSPLRQGLESSGRTQFSVDLVDIACDGTLFASRF